MKLLKKPRLVSSSHSIFSGYLWDRSKWGCRSFETGRFALCYYLALCAWLEYMCTSFINGTESSVHIEKSGFNRFIGSLP